VAIVEPGYDAIKQLSRQQRGLGVCVVRGAEHGDEQLDLPDLAGRRVVVRVLDRTATRTRTHTTTNTVTADEDGAGPPGQERRAQLLQVSAAVHSPSRHAPLWQSAATLHESWLPPGWHLSVV